MVSISDSVKKDHKELEAFHNQIVNADNDIIKTRFQNQFVWELARHSAAEELLLYPALEKHLADGKERVEKDRERHQKTKEQLMEFQSMKPTDANFEPTVNSLMDNLSTHMRDEEGDNLPALENAISNEDSEELSKSFKRTKMFVPTRLHPAAPNQPAFESVIGFMMAPIDKLADTFRRFP
ncbi:HHE domain-containing protein [Histoplasma ohiense]|nr:HHE domain-containing protein [Histoplasma ohiense (nom. inval.)]